MILTPDVRLTYQNARGGSMTLAMFSEYFLESCEDSVENNIYSEKQGNLDGEMFFSMSLEKRNVEIFGFFNTGIKQREMKREMEKVFNPTLPGKLTYYDTRKKIKRTLECYTESVPNIEFNPSSHNVEFTISLVALEPFWRGEGQQQEIAYAVPMGEFPIVIDMEEKFIFGYRSLILENVVDNVGDSNAAVTFRLRATNGTVTNPEITRHDSGRTIKIFYEMQDGDYIDIVSEKNFVSVIINGTENGMGYLTDPSKRQFFLLFVGQNKIGYNADINVSNLDVSFAYTDLYLGADT